MENDILLFDFKSLQFSYFRLLKITLNFIKMFTADLIKYTHDEVMGMNLGEPHKLLNYLHIFIFLCIS